MILSFGRIRLFLLLTATLLVTTPWAERPHLQTGVQQASALVLVNSQSPNYGDFTRYIRPYLDHFGVPYAVADLANGGVPANLGQYALLVVGHRRLDASGTYLTATANSDLAAAVQAGTGLVNFDSTLTTTAGNPAYQYVQDIFGFSYFNATAAADASVASSAPLAGYVIEAQDPGASYVLSRSIVPQGVTLAAGGDTLVSLGGQPLLAARQYGAGRAVQWTTYEWMRADTWGYFHGWDDLVWRGMVWAARKPFVMQGLPPLVTMRVDDTTGPYWWTSSAVQQGFKPWLGVFLDDQDAADTAAIRTLVQAGNATASVHARSQNNFFYFDHNFGNGSNWPDAVVAQNFADATAWHQANQIPISKYVLPHYYEFGTNVFSGLQQWGVQFVGTVVAPGQPYGASTPTLNLRPFRLFETPCPSNCSAPIYLADQLAIPGHPEFNGVFFNGLTEVRDLGGYEWYPNGDVPSTSARGVAQIKRALDSMALASLFTHEYYIQDISPAAWSQIMGQVASGISAYQPEFVTLDDGLRYVRATTTSDIQTSTYSPSTKTLATRMVGSTDVATRISLFTDYAGGIRRDFVTVPAFTGQTDVSFDVSSLPALPVRIDVWRDANQSPVLATTTDPAALLETDNAWTEFLLPSRGYPGVFASVNEAPPLMQFHAAVPNGTYNLFANLYWNGNLRYRWGYSPATATQFSVDVTSGATPGEFGEYALGQVVVTNGVFELYTQGAQALPGGSGYPFYGWAWLRLVPATSTVPAVTIDDVSVTEGASGTSNATFTVALSAASTSTVTVAYATADGTATAPGDYTGASGVVTFLPGQTSRPVVVPVLGDTTVETDESFSVVLSSPANATLAKSIGIGTIVNDDAPPLTIDVWRDANQSPVLATTSDLAALNGTDNAWTEFLYAPRGYPGVFASVNEAPPVMRFFGAVPNGTYDVSASLYWNTNLRYRWGYSAATASQFSVDVTNGPAAGDFNDYPLGQVVVSNGTFELYTSGAQLLPGGSGYPFYGWARIRLTPVFAGGGPSLSIDDVAVTEGQSGTSNATFTVTLSNASAQTVTVAYATGNATATAPGDYTATSGTLTFAPGQVTRTIDVPVLGDLLPEPDETFTVTLAAPANATLAKAVGVGTIRDDEPGPVRIDVWQDANQSPVLPTTTDPLALVDNDNQWTEFLSPTRGFPGVFASTQETPPVMRFAGSVPNGTYDLVAGLYWNGNLRYRWGYSAQAPSLLSVDVTTGPVNGEFSEYPLGRVVVTNGLFELYTGGAQPLPGGTGYPFFGWAWLRLIPSTDPLPAASVNDVSVVEGNSGTTAATFTVSLSAPSASPVTVAYATADGTASTPGDYSAASGTLTFAPGQTTRPVTVTIVGDTSPEPNETFTVTLSAPTNATLAKYVGGGTILNDEASEVRIDAWRDEHQSPVLATTSDANALDGADNQWTEFLFPARGYPGVFASTSEAPPLMRFFGNAPNGTYRVVANLYWSANLRYRWGYTAADPTAFSYDVTTGTPGEFSEYTIGQVEVTNGVFDLFTQGAQPLPGGSGYPFFGWAWIRLVPLSQPSVSVSPATVTEGTGGTTTASFTVGLSAAATVPVTVAYATSDGTASAADYVPASGSLTFAPGETSKVVAVTVQGDALDEADETFLFTLSAPTNAALGVATAIGTIVDDDPTPTLSIADAAPTSESAAGISFAVTLSAASGRTVSIDYATADGSATAGADYVLTTGTLTIAPGQLSGTVTVPLLADALDEIDEGFSVTIGNAVGATITRTAGSAVIVDDDPAPTIAIASIAVGESSGAAAVDVSLSAPSGRTITVRYATTPGSATAADFTAASGTLTFAPGVTALPVSVPILSDALDELDETFTVGLSLPVNATIASGTGTVTILDDDATPSLSIAGGSSSEGNASLPFTVTLSAPSGRTVTVGYATADGTAVAAADYTATSGVLTFTPGQTSRTVSVPLINDTLDENSETVTVVLSNPTNAVLAQATGTGTITDNDPQPSLSIGAASVAESAGQITFPITLSPASGRTVTVVCTAASGGTATANVDYTATTTTVTFVAGQTGATCVVPVLEDALDEADETFNATLSGAVNASVGTGTAAGTILDNDATPTLSIGTVAPSPEGTSPITFTVSLSAPSGRTVTVGYATASGTALSGSDFTAASGTLTFSPGQTTRTVNVAVTNDARDEADETFSVSLSTPSNATLAQASSVATIVDDDATPTLSVGDRSATESAGSMTFTVTLSAASNLTVTAAFETAPGTAADPADYAATSGTVTFTPGQTSRTIVVPIVSDALDESNETFTVALSSPANASIVRAVATGTIVDDDPTPSLSASATPVTEGDTGSQPMVFTVTLSAASGRQVSVNYATSNISASAGSDYVATSGALIFAPGQTSRTITVDVLGDVAVEPTESLRLTLSGAVNASLSSTTATGTIVDNDSPGAP